MPVKARKAISHGAPVGGLIRADFEGGDAFKLNGYWMHPTRRAQVEVPIFQHAFYPKLDHTDLDVQQNITYRNIIVPSIADLHQAGIRAEKAIFVAEIWTHPRYIKHHNFFRGEYPASVKTHSRQTGVTFVFAAADMPFARLKRKQVLNFYRAAFTPLLLKGRHYTSGRMSFFFVAPSHVTAPLKQSLNLEDINEYNLNESWTNAVHPLLRSKRMAANRHINYEKEITKKVQKEIHDVVLPIVSSQFDIPLSSAEGRKLAQMMDSPRFAQDFVQATEGKPNRFAAVKRWVKNSFWPRLKDIVTTETGNALEDGARYAVRLALSVAFDRALDKLKALPDPAPGTSAKRPWAATRALGRTARRFDFNMDYGSGSFGLGQVGYKSGSPKSRFEIERKINAVKQELVGAVNAIPSFQHSMQPLGQLAPNLFKLVVDSSGKVHVDLDNEYIEKVRR